MCSAVPHEDDEISKTTYYASSFIPPAPAFPNGKFPLSLRLPQTPVFGVSLSVCGFLCSEIKPKGI